MTNERCIYCCKEFDHTHGQGDHIISGQLGEFRNDLRFRRICPACNSKIGRSEQQFLQCGPEAFFRMVVQPALRRRRQSGRSARGALGMPPPKSVIRLGDHGELVKPVPGDHHAVTHVDHIVIHGKDGSQLEVRLFRGMRPEQLQEKVAAPSITEFNTAWLHCDEATCAEFQALVQAAWPQVRLRELAPTEPGAYKVAGRITFTFSDHYFRAIAKIAFHYYLVHTRRGLRGDESGFDPIRQFIMDGGDTAPFFHSSGHTFCVPFGELPGGGAVVPNRWFHVLAADESSNVIVVYVRLFVGPESVRDPYYVTLGPLNSRIDLPRPVWGHVYEYDDPQPTSGRAGQVLEASITRLR